MARGKQMVVLRPMATALLLLGSPGCAPRAATENAAEANSSADRPSNADVLATEPTHASSSTSSTRDLLISGQGAACVQADVRNTVISAVRPEQKFPSDWTPEEIASVQIPVSYAIDAVTLVGVDRDTSRMACQANITIVEQGEDGRTFPIRYTLSPSLDGDGSVVVNTSAGDATAYAKDLGIDRNAASMIELRKISARLAPPPPTDPDYSRGNSD